MCKPPKITLKSLKISYEEIHFLKKLLNDLTLSRLFLKDLPKYIPEHLLSSALFYENFSYVCCQLENL